jgi:hypothetical protein
MPIANDARAALLGKLCQMESGGSNVEVKHRAG